jgi:hypothetical protein
VLQASYRPLGGIHDLGAKPSDALLGQSRASQEGDTKGNGKDEPTLGTHASILAMVRSLIAQRGR